MPSLASLRRALEGSLPPPADPATARAAAVAALFREGPQGAEVLLIRRSEREGDPWSGHMALPGGRRERADVDLLATAVRETAEEIGVDLTRCAELIGVLEDQDATGRGSIDALPIRPFVFELWGDVQLSLSGEVSEVLWSPVRPILSGERRTTKAVAYQGQEYVLPGWDVEGRVVWGLTFRMLSSLFSRL